MIRLSPFTFSENAEAGSLKPKEEDFLNIDASASGIAVPMDDARINTRLDELVSCETFVLHGEAGPRLLGTLALYQTRDVLWIDAMAVRASRRSGGLGSAVLGWAEAYAQKKGLCCVQGHALANPMTLNFYAKNGYEQLRPVGGKYVAISKQLVS